MNKTTIKRVISCCMVIGLTISLLSCMSPVCERKASKEKYKDFFSQQGDFDVLFLGTSHVLYGIFFFLLWDDFGIISYNMATHSNTMPINYWALKNALDYTTPKLVVVDCYNIFNDHKMSGNFSHTHLMFDAFPLSKTKIETVNDLVDKNELQRDNDGESPSKLGLLWDFSVYHSRWNQLTREDFFVKYNPEKGAGHLIGVYPGRLVKNEEYAFINDTLGQQYLHKIIRECQERNIEVLLTYISFPASKEEQDRAHNISRIAEQYQVEYINFFDLNVVDYATDYYDNAEANSHVNVSGAKKVTKYLGEIIQKKYHISDQRGNPIYAHWYDDYERYTIEKNGWLLSQEQLDNYLMLLYDKQYDVIMEVKDKRLYQSRAFNNLLKNLGLQEDEAKSFDLLTIQGGKKANGIIIKSPGEKTEKYATDIGDILIQPTDQPDGGKNYAVFYNGVTINNTALSNSIRITVMKADTTKVVDRVAFDIAITGNEDEIGFSTIQAVR